MKEMEFHWQLNTKELKMLKGLNRIKEKYALAVKEFMESRPVSEHMLLWYEACNPAYEVSVEMSRMDKKFCTKEKGEY